MWSPVWEPPRRPRVRTVVRIARWSRTRSSAVSGLGGPSRIDPGAPERFVGEQVAETGDARLVHEHRLHRGTTARNDLVETSPGERRARRDRDGSRRDRARLRRGAAGPATTSSLRRRIGRRIDARPGSPCCSRRAAGSPAASPSTITRPLIPRWRPSVGPSSLVSISRSLPRRRASTRRATRQGRLHRRAT